MFIYLGFVVFLFSTVWVFRLNIFLMPFLYLWFGIMLYELDYSWLKKSYFIFVLGLFVFGMSVNIYLANPIVNDDFVEAL